MKLSTKLYLGGLAVLAFTPFTLTSLAILAGGVYTSAKLKN